MIVFHLFSEVSLTTFSHSNFQHFNTRKMLDTPFLHRVFNFYLLFAGWWLLWW